MVEVWWVYLQPWASREHELSLKIPFLGGIQLFGISSPCVWNSHWSCSMIVQWLIGCSSLIVIPNMCFKLGIISSHRLNSRCFLYGHLNCYILRMHGTLNNYTLLRTFPREILPDRVQRHTLNYFRVGFSFPQTKSENCLRAPFLFLQ